MVEHKGTIFGIIGGGIFFTILILLLYLRWISVTAFFIILALKLVIITGIIVTVFLIRKFKQKAEPQTDQLAQNISRAELITLAKETVLNDMAEHFLFKNVLVRNVGGRGKLTPIAVIYGRGDISKKDITILIDLHKPRQIPTILINASEAETREALEGMAASPPMRETKVITRKDSMGNEIVEKTESDEFDVEAEEAKKEGEL